MKKILVLLVLALFQFSFAQNLVVERAKMDKAIKSKTHALKYIAELEKENNKKPIMRGLLGMTTMIMAKHTSNPFKKMSYFKKGKVILEDAIKKDPTNVELRFFRLTVQENAPSIANYKKNIESDRAYINKKYNSIKDANLKKSIREYKNKKK